MRIPKLFRDRFLASQGSASRSEEVLQAKLVQSGNQPEGADIFESMLQSVPAIRNDNIAWGNDNQTGVWWCMFYIDVHHPDAFRTIQHFSYELNNDSANDFSGAFYPKAPYPGANPETEKFLHWMIDCWDGNVSAKHVANMLELAALELSKNS